jgi:apolipoprotein N-acyltransferase
MAVLDVRPYQRLETTLFAQWRYWPLLGVLLAGLLVSFAVVRAGRRKAM